MKLNKYLVAGALMLGLVGSSAMGSIDKNKQNPVFLEKDTYYGKTAYLHIDDSSVPDILEIKLKDDYDDNVAMGIFNDYDKNDKIGNHPKDIYVELFGKGKSKNGRFVLSDLHLPEGFSYTVMITGDFCIDARYSILSAYRKNMVYNSTPICDNLLTSDMTDNRGKGEMSIKDEIKARLDCADSCYNEYKSELFKEVRK